MSLGLIRKIFGIKLSEISALTGCSLSLIFLIEKGGRNPTPDFQRKICRAIRVLVADKISPDMLFFQSQRKGESNGKAQSRTRAY
jgi:transcriptional regulator with XRE-family HTH domain